MPIEIERKFLLKNSNWRLNARCEYCCQGFLSTVKERTVRVRIMGERAWLTVKGKNIGAARPEYEYEIPLADARQILDNLCLRPLIEKTRFYIDYAGLTWEVDEFHGENEGLILAELELEDENTQPSFPDWVGAEVTGDPRYFNANLIENPYKNWPKST